MTLANGTKLGPYELLGLLGAGGMGEVYRARDTRLDRTVAIKVLLSTVTASAGLRARFEREARAISALSHPNICALYDVGVADGAEYLVMEYLDGEMLSDKIARGPLPLSQVLRYGVQIAEALQCAHRAGIVHRDLKPGNVMITSAGAKLLDFGLAKFRETPRVFSDESATVTRIEPLTAEGMIVGTIQYMAPEQLEGKAGDHRSDVFALGAILHEMATGQRPFRGTSRAGIVSAILADDPPPLRTLVPAAPAALERIIVTALEKNPDERWQTAQDVARQLRWLTESSPATERSVVAPGRSRRLVLPAIVAVAALLAALITWAAMRRLGPAGAPGIARLHYALPADMRGAASFDSRSFALSPDGSTLCFAATRGGMTSLFLRRLDSLELRKVDGTEDASAPFWSSDNEWIGFSARGKMWKTRIGGGAAPTALCDIAATGALASWRGSTILFCDRPGGRGEIYLISADGGPAHPVTTRQKGEWRHGWPVLLPDGEHFLYQAFAGDSTDRHLILASLNSPQRLELLSNVSEVSLVAADRLIYVRDGKLLAQHFDARKGMTGEPTLLAGDVSYFFPAARAEFDAAPNGTIVYRTNTSTGRLSSVDRSGTVKRVIDDRGPFFDVGLSPDGKQAAVMVLDRATGLGDIWIYDLARAVRDRFTSDPGLEAGAVWAPDGRSIVYSEAEGGSYPRMVRRSLGATASQEITRHGTFEFAGSFSADGQSLFFTRNDPRTRGDIFRLDLRTGAEQPVLNSTFSEDDAQASRDGKWLAFESDATGSFEVYLKSLSGGTAPIRISTNGGHDVRWRQDSGELFYLSAQNDVVAVRPGANGDWNDAVATTLFRAPADAGHLAAAPDGQSFLILEGAPGAGDALFNVVLGWR